jgi:TonB-dependent SusC/RagA subfamily outer membrane receptor
VVLFLPTVIFAQSVTVTGKITDNKDGAPLQGATISVKNSKTSTVSDTKGNFSIKAPSSESVITITYIGYGVYESKAGNGVMNVELKNLNTDLDDVVVVGYGSQKKSHLTGSVGSVDMKTIEDLPIGSLSEALKNQIVGVNVNGGFKRPGEAASITIRNPVYYSKDGGSKDPIYVIDDIIRDKSDFDLLDASEVENISVLKDAAAAIYGIIGSNGVIIVKTKRGKSGISSINYSSSIGTSYAPYLP